MDVWLTRVCMLVTAVFAIWLFLSRSRGQRRMPQLLEELSGRAVLLFSGGGELLALGPVARKVLGLDGRVDRIRTEDLPLEGLDSWLLAEQSQALAGARSLAPLILHGESGAAPVRANLVPVRPEVGPLPAWLSFEPPVREEAPEPAASAGTLDGVRILLAEDSPDNQLLISYFLQGEGAQLVLVENGKEAVDRVRECAFDVVFLDMQMPVMDGYEAARQIAPLAPGMPIVALTARNDADDEERCLDAGCTHYLSKPVKRKQILELTESLVSAASSTELTEDDLFADPEFQELIAEFVSELSERVSEMQSALAESDWESLETLAHRLKGAAGGFGLPEISEASSRLEACARMPEDAGDPAGALADLEERIAQALAASASAATST